MSSNRALRNAAAVAIAVALCLGARASSGAEDEWPGFRGARADGISTATGVFGEGAIDEVIEEVVVRQLGARAASRVAREQIRAYVRTAAHVLEDLAHVREHPALLLWQLLRQQRLVASDHAADRRVIDGEVEHLKGPHGNLIVGQAGDSKRRQLKITIHPLQKSTLKSLRLSR